MSPKRRPIEFLVWGGLAFTVVGIVAAFVISSSRSKANLPAIYGQVTAFSLTNQAGAVVSNDQLAGRIWLADIIFTRCAGPCPKLSRQMEALKDHFAGTDGVRFVSLTADPAFDTPEVLARYAGRFGAVPDRWQFLTGSKPDLYRLASEGLKLAVMEKEKAEQENLNDLFIHSTVMTLVDREGRLRGFFEGLEPGSRERIIEAVNALLSEGKGGES